MRGFGVRGFRGAEGFGRGVSGFGIWGGERVWELVVSDLGTGENGFKGVKG